MIRRIFEELFPFIYRSIYVRKIERRIQNEPERNNDLYSKLEVDELNNRIEQEHTRARLLDEKTYKMTLSLTIGLILVNSTFAFLIKEINYESLQMISIVLLWISIFYLLISGYIALSSLRSLATYGYGTIHLINYKETGKSILTKALNLQEETNIIRHLNNESSFQCLRNGFLLLFPVFAIFFLNWILGLIC